MSISKDKTYLVYNHNPHVVCFTAKRETYTMPPAGADGPSAIPLTVDEIISLNTSSRVFKNGLLRFDESIEAEMYETLRITNWQDIMTNEKIEDVIAHPTAESLEKLIRIDDQMYFNRVYGIFVGMRNAGVEISSKVESVVRERYRELRDGIRTTRIVVTPIESPVDSSKRINELEAQLANMQQMLQEALALRKEPAPVVEQSDTPSEAPAVKKAARKPAASKDKK